MNPIRNAYDRTCLYASNIAIECGKQQPVHFALGEVYLYALELLLRRGHDTKNLRSKSWDEFEEAGAPAMDFVFTVCDSAANGPCPVWPGRPVMAHRGLADPADVQGTETERREAFERTYRLLKERVAEFLVLPFDSLDSEELRARLERVGRLGSRTDGG